MGAVDRIELRGLHVRAVVGVLPHERLAPQPLEIDLDLVADLGPAGDSDALVDTIDYGEVCDVVRRTVTSLEPLLLERLAVVAAEQVLALDARVESVTVSIRKLAPPVDGLTTSGVRVTRGRAVPSDPAGTV